MFFATLKSIDYNVAMTFILNNINNNNVYWLARNVPKNPTQFAIMLYKIQPIQAYKHKAIVGS